MKLLKRTLALTLSAAMALGLLSGCGSDASANVLNVYNWGEYIDTDLLDRFEQETGIKVIYNTFDSNENLYSRIQTTSYDVIIPSDYAISRFIDEDMLQPLNFDNIPNMKYIDEKYTHLDFDPEQKYSVPYTWGVVGIVYNTKYVDEADTGSWDLLWNPKYANRTAMFNNSRDALGIALMYLGCSLNTTDRDELRQAADLIIAGKPVYQGIWMDQILEKLPAEEIVAAPYYNGDAVTMIDENPDLAFYVPKEGTNLFVDAMCIPKNAKNVEGAEKFINFMCSTEAAMANWEYIGYSSPHTGVYEQLDEETRNDPLYFPDTSAYPTEAYTNLPKDISQYYNDRWVDILTERSGSKGDAVPLRYAPGSEETGGDNPLSSAQRTRPRRRGAGRGIKVRQSWTFMGNFMRRSAERLPCLFCLRQKSAGDCAPQGREKARFCVPFLTFHSGIYGFYG